MFQSVVGLGVSYCCGNGLSWYPATITDSVQRFNFFKLRTKYRFSMPRIPRVMILKQFWWS